jgi:hypothetical protein
MVTDTGAAANDPVRLVELLARGGATGLIVNDPRSALVTECSRRHIPVFARSDDESSEGWDKLKKRLADDNAAAADGYSRELFTLLDQVATDIGGTAHLIFPGGVVQPTHRRSPEFLRTAARKTACSVTAVPKEGRVLHLKINADDVDGVSSAGTSLLLCRDHPSSWPLTRLSAFDKQLSALMADIDIFHRVREPMERTFLQELLAGSLETTAVLPWAESLGLPSGGRVMAVVLVGETMIGRGAVIGADAVREVLLATGRRGIVAADTDRHRVLALLVLQPSTFADRLLTEAVETMVARLSRLFGMPVAAGSSTGVVSTADDLVLALVNASQIAEREARRLDNNYRGPGEDDEDRGSSPLRVPLAASLITAPDAAEVLENSVLRPLLTTDDRRDSHYLETLRTFLLLNCKMSDTAAELDVHINTLRYRLSKIEALTGRDLHVTADRVDFYLALTLRESTASLRTVPHQGSASFGGNSASTS